MFLVCPKSKNKLSLEVKLVHNEIIFLFHKMFITFFILFYLLYFVILFPSNAFQYSSEKELKVF